MENPNNYQLEDFNTLKYELQTIMHLLKPYLDMKFNVRPMKQSEITFNLMEAYRKLDEIMQDKLDDL